MKREKKKKSQIKTENTLGKKDREKKGSYGMREIFQRDLHLAKRDKERDRKRLSGRM